jgi:molybdopterin-containing oxidoreductase family iron-sulfur binding subunit
MKRVFEHPAAPATGRTYWKSVEEYAGTPEFREWLEREFPAGAAEMEGDGVSRRSFLQLMGASLALAGFGLTGCRRPEAYLVPYTTTPEWLVPGKYLHYSSAMPRRRGAAPILVTTFDGRPTKIEGHPDHVQSRGKSDAFTQASILDLYDPDRSKTVLHEGKVADEAALVSALAGIRAGLGDGAGLVIVADEVLSPTRERLRAELARQFPKMTWAVHEPLVSGNDAEAVRIAFGEGVRLLPQLDKARVILALDSDFLGNDEGGLKAVRDFADGRRVKQAGDAMNRLYVVENRYTNTGAMADHRLRLAASQIGPFAVALARELAAQGVAGLADVAAKAGSSALPESVDPKWITECARDLAAQAGRSLVVTGANQPVSVQLVVLAINQALRNIGSTLLAVQDKSPARAASLADVAAKIKAGSVSTLVLLNVNPVYNAPADLDWESLQKSVATVVHLGLHADETAAASTWHIPAAHYLETWGDALAADGSLLPVQPMILPLYNGWSACDLLAVLAGQPKPAGPGLVQETFRQLRGANGFEDAWTAFLHQGVLPGSAAQPVSVSFNSGRVATALASSPIVATAPSREAFEVVFAPDYSMDDGRFNNNGWMQEWPDPVTKLTWDNAALISSTTAKALGVRSRMRKGKMIASVVRIELDGRTVEVPVLVIPGCADFTITLPLGYGRKITGRVGDAVGFNAYAIRTTTAPLFATGAKVAAAGRDHTLAVTQDHHSMEGRALVREAPLAHFEKDPEFASKMHVDAHQPEIRSFYKSPPLDAPHQWAMAIDLTTCTGCNACVVACQGENNIPIVGKDQVLRGREMHWIRIDRYFVSETPYTEDYPDQDNPLPDDAEVLVQPVTCMQCENAPCETVCPVNATVHNEEGLNVMAYNRCIGTRYCANNCPYKVRRFNFFDYNQRPIDYGKTDITILGVINAGNLYKGPFAPKGMEESLKMQKNPNVTVRMRGVMEKCTFCVQRLEEAKIAQKVKARDSADILVPRDSVQVACQQACPADAIVFGNKKDPESRIAKALKQPQGYKLLNYLNTQPRITYLARLRNPNPLMPKADLVGMSTLANEHHAHADAHGEHSVHGEAAPAEHSAHGDKH